MEQILKLTEDKMQKSIENVGQQLARLRTGKATPSLLDGIKVDYYGNTIPLNQLASISVPEARLLVIHPWDKTSLASIEKAILASDLGLTPNSDGNVIRIPIPLLSEERRKELIKVARKIAEEGRVAVRNIRRETIDEIKNKQKEGTIPEDHSFKLQEKVQELTDKYSKKIDELLKKKEDEIMQI